MGNEQLLDRLCRKLVRRTFVVNAAHAIFRVLPGPVLDMIPWAVRYLLLVKSHCAVTMHTSNSFTRDARNIGSSHFNPFP
jgi:hypothetical protein